MTPGPRPAPLPASRPGVAGRLHATMGMMRILHFVTRSHRRGAELVAVELARGLDSLGHTNQVLRVAFKVSAQLLR